MRLTGFTIIFMLLISATVYGECWDSKELRQIRMNELEGDYSFSEFRYNIVLERQLLDAFISHIIPWVVVSFILFGMFLTANKDQDYIALSGFSAFGVLGITSSLFFVVLVSHIQIRNALQVPSPVYLEYFYFLLYLIILIKTVHSLIFTSNRINWYFIEYKNSLFIKLLYWPFLTGSLLLITLAFFYN